MASLAKPRQLSSFGLTVASPWRGGTTPSGPRMRSGQTLRNNKIGRRRILTIDAEIDRAIERAKSGRGEPLVTEVEYRLGTGLDLLILKLSDGHRHVIPREELPGLQSATKEQLSERSIRKVD